MVAGGGSGDCVRRRGRFLRPAAPKPCEMGCAFVGRASRLWGAGRGAGMVLFRIMKRMVKMILPYFMVRLYQECLSKIKDQKMKDENLLEVENYEKSHGTYAYAPWLSDGEFNAVYNKIKNHTLLGKQKSYVLWELVKRTNLLQGSMLEVGVWRGGSGALIGKQAEHSAHCTAVYLCDTFTGVVKTGEKDSYYKDGAHADTAMEVVEELLKELEIKNVAVLQGIFPEKTGSMIQDAAFRFCHIDVDVYQSTKDIFEWVWPKMVVGGILVLDDYGWYLCEGVTKFVNEETLKGDRVVVNNWIGQAIIVKI
jgi:O-methyltransferase